MIYLNRPFIVGDWIQVPEYQIDGTVEDIGWHMTCIRGQDKKAIYLPNSLLLKVVILNPQRMSHREFSQRLYLRAQDAVRIADVVKK
jgi:Small-conductance mechanosensitive channel